MSKDYRNPEPMHFGPPSKELKGDGKPMYPDKYPELVDHTKEIEQLKKDIHFHSVNATLTSSVDAMRWHRAQARECEERLKQLGA